VEHGGNTEMQPVWRLLYAAGADVVLSGHEHNYERFAPQDPNGFPDPQHGIRAFVVGTGGASHYPFGTPLPNSEVRNADTYGVLVLTLQANGYDWEFVPVEAGGDQPEGTAFTDSGSTACH
jgi:acid phosphatase type 7